MNIENLCIDLLKRSLSPIPQELNELDWKVMLSSKKERLKKHLSAFANLKDGGFLIFGVDDDGKIIGIPDEDSRLIADILANMARTALEPQINIKFITFEFKAKNLLGIYIEESFEKPVHIKNKGLERSYIRAGGQSRLMNKDEIRHSILSSRTLRFGELPASLSREYIEKWDDCFNFSEVIKRTMPNGFSDQSSQMEYLASLKLFDKSYEKFSPTNLAIICCAKDFNKLISYEKFALRMVEYKGNTKITARRDKTFQMGFSLSLDLIIDTLIHWLPYTEKVQRATVIRTPIIPEVALREIIVNAIIHRDYTITSSSITVEVFSDRVEVTSPGGLLPEVTVDRLIDHPSRTRNEVLSDLMRKLNFCEERGSGIDKSVIAMEKNGYPAIQFINEPGYFKVILSAHREFSSLTNDEKMNAIFQHCCLNVVIQRKTTGRSIRDRFHLNRSESTKIYKLIEEIIRLGKIKLANPESSRRDQYYLPYWA